MAKKTRLATVLSLGPGALRHSASGSSFPPPPFARAAVAATYLAADTCQMAVKTEPTRPISWAIYNVTTRAVWLGTIEAVDEAAAVEKATQEFKTDVRWLYAVQRL
jgi:hypothetical protein